MVRPYYEDTNSRITIYHGDCETVLAEVDDVDIVVTSPPYNMGLKPGGNGRGMYRPGATGSNGARFRDGYDGEHDDAMPQDEYDTWQRRVLIALWAKARLGIFYNHRPRVEHGVLRLPLAMDFGPLPLRKIIVWDRGVGIDINLGYYATCHEWVLLFAKPEFALVDHAASGRGDVWHLGIAHGVDHPAPFPVGLPARAIVSTAATSVLDPFMGSGTTLRAAKDAGVRAVGIDQSERYCEQAARRLAAESLWSPPAEQHQQVIGW